MAVETVMQMASMNCLTLTCL